MERKCLVCDDPVIGRIDKKFCSDQCRSTFNNQMKKELNNYVKRVNYILRKNRRILNQLNPTGRSKVHRFRMMDMGFDFNYFTNVYNSNNGNVYYFCYDQGYQSVENDYFSLVERQENIF